MADEPRKELVGWEGEAGSVDAVPGHADGLRDVPCVPDLPAGYETQPFWGFHDGAGRFAYELNRVYGPASALDARGPVRRLDEDLSYWGVTWRKLTGTVDERPAGRWMTYARARKLRPLLTFERFSSLQMRDELPGLLEVRPAPVVRKPEPPAEAAIVLVPAPRPS
jgi:hypothetical protein